MPTLNTVKHQARKRFGQNFLIDQGVIGAIVQAIAPCPEQTVVEIGPGLGALTGPLQEHLKELTVIELDRDLAAQLRQRPGLKVIEADVLKVDFAQLVPPRGKLRVVGNLPYNISTPILFHLLSASAVIQDQHFMLQKEVVARMVAAAATSDYGRLSVMLQWRYAMTAVLEVPPQSFNPEPKVNSTVVRMVPHEHPVDLDAACLSNVVRVAFSQRRKLLRHTLGRWLEEHGFEEKFDTQRRAEEVPVQEYLQLAQKLEPKPSLGHF